ncbi:MAG TPA: T9SS type A sorting domain-containing protein [Parafilimonas sp.]|nr:T9SS type A sorting domain-containing protein [Parafilimonas sp.]
MKTILFSILCALVTTLGNAQAGTLDTTFGKGGGVITDFRTSAGAKDEVIQPDGKIVVVGISENKFSIARYLVNGELDPSFGKHGRMLTAIPGHDICIANAVALQSDGKILVAGTAGDDFAVVRYNPGGAIDTSFGTGGGTVTDFRHGEDAATDMVIQPDGKILVSGYTFTSYGNFALARYQPNGVLDSNFGKDGKIVTTIRRDDRSQCMALQPDGKIILAGDADWNFGMVRYKKSGDLDSSFGSNGRVLTKMVRDNIFCFAIAIQPDGKIILGGRAFNGPGPIIARYKMNGELDSTFGVNGFVKKIEGGVHKIYSLRIQPDGKILAAGAQGIQGSVTGYDYTLLRYLPTGRLDTTFGTNGQADPVDFNKKDDDAYAMALQSDGKIVLAGTATIRIIKDGTYYYYTEYGVVRFNNDIGNVDKKQYRSLPVAQSSIYEENKVVLYPNPVRDVLNIRGLDQFTNYDLRITNAKGSVVARDRNAQSGLNGIYTMQAQSLSSGLYYSTITSPNKKTTVKFVKE